MLAHRTKTGDEVSFRTCQFLILGQGYVAERVEVRLPLTVSAVQALQFVSAARLPQDTAKLPCIQAVFPQPRGSHALCVATPPWETAGALVLFDCRNVDGRLFALHIVGRSNRRGLLTAAGIPDNAGVSVFIGNQPWPLVDGPSIDLIPGELILITPTQAPHHTVASLQDMLASPDEWPLAADTAPWVTSLPATLARVLGDEDSIFFEIRPDRHRQLRQDIAAALRASSRELVLQTAHLPYPDYAQKGTHVCSIIAALRYTGFLPSQARSVVCFIDARPILFEVHWRVCPEGLLDTGAVAQCYAAHCPSGYTFCLLDPSFEVLQLGAFVRVNEGEVLTAMYRPFQVFPDDAVQIDPHSTSPDADDDNADDSEANDPQQSLTYGASYPASSQQHADTGGTAHVYGSQRSPPACGFSVMWPAKFLTIAVLAGTWPITPDCSHAECCDPSVTVCETCSHIDHSFEAWVDIQPLRNHCATAPMSTWGKPQLSVCLLRAEGHPA